ncbi:amino acid synthesis family protein [Candidatus Pelagibacter sp.]|nr:amino acid synthesis family protein [Candidatus Pelagibacter sp.]
MDLKLRKFAKFVDKTFIEGKKKAKEPVLLVSVAAVIENPWAGRGFVEDLKPEILDLAPQLGDLLVTELTKEIGSGEKISAYGKAAMVGLNGEIEHASAFIHTLRFGNKFRDAVGGTSYLSFTNTRGPAGAKVSIPMMHKTDAGLRPFYLTHEFTIHDAPNEDEIVVAIGGSPTGRAHARTGDRYQDMKEMGIDN